MEKLKQLLQNHLFMSAFYKGISGLSMFVSIPLLIHYFGETNYGVWVLVFALFQWVLLMDFGLASVLKTKIPELQHSGNTEMINAYIKSTYKISSYIALGIFVLFCLVFAFFNVQNLLNINFETSFVTKLFLLNIFFFCVNFIFNTQKALFVGFHKGKFSEQSIAVNQIFFLLFLALPIFLFPSIDGESKLVLVSIINGIVTLVVNLIYTIYLFRIEKISFFTKKEASKEYLKEVYRLGFKFMAIQIGTLFLFSSDNYILAYFFGPKDIVPYEIVTKYFQFPLMIITAGMSPLWSVFTKHYLEKNKSWLQTSIKKFNIFYLLVILAMVIFILIAPAVMKIWISKDFSVGHFLLIVVAIVTSLRIYTSFYIYFFSGIGKLKSYMILLFVSVFLKIPLSYLFIKLDFGISSVVLASGVCLLVWSIFQPLEAKKIISNLNQPINNDNQ